MYIVLKELSHILDILSLIVNEWDWIKLDCNNELITLL